MVPVPKFRTALGRLNDFSTAVLKGKLWGIPFGQRVYSCGEGLTETHSRFVI